MRDSQDSGTYTHLPKNMGVRDHVNIAKDTGAEKMRSSRLCTLSATLALSVCFHDAGATALTIHTEAPKLNVHLPPPRMNVQLPPPKVNVQPSSPRVQLHDIRIEKKLDKSSAQLNAVESRGNHFQSPKTAHQFDKNNGGESKGGNTKDGNTGSGGLLNLGGVRGESLDPPKNIDVQSF
jgi:hypothetical protein